MNVFGALGGQLLLFGLALLLMQAALRSGASKGLFAALPLGMLPALLVSVGIFVQIQDPKNVEMLAVRQAFTAQVEIKAAQVYPKAEDLPQRDVYRTSVLQGFEVVPAFMFSCHLGVLAAMAVLLRRRYTLAGKLPEAEPLWQWTAPWGLVWLILAPSLFLAAAVKGLIQTETVYLHAAWNLLTVGMVIAIFQGAVVFWAKLRIWWQAPNTRPLVYLVISGVLLSVLLQNAIGLLTFLLLIGLFEPWVDVRRLRQPPPEAGLKP